ncbi:MAG: hypothetical protein H8E16_11965 [Flavobacteriales bacterium]|nr:hypothetical protein [Flavobacteriales bacterium]
MKKKSSNSYLNNIWLNNKIGLMTDLIYDYKYITDLDCIFLFESTIIDIYESELALNKINKPKTKDLKRLAITSAIVERLVEVFNNQPHNRSEKLPKWVGKVAALKNKIYVSPKEMVGNYPNPIFKSKNIMATQNFMFFI